MAVAAFSESKWYFRYPPGSGNLSHITCPPNRGYAEIGTMRS